MSSTRIGIEMVCWGLELGIGGISIECCIRSFLCSECPTQSETEI